MAVPSYLAGYERPFERDPKAAALEWFRDARFGLFLHYGVYSQLGRGEWVMFRDKIPVAEYAKLKDTFTAAKFDAEAICDLALAAKMRYVTITTRHHDCNLLLNTGPLPDGSINAVDAATLREVGRRIRQSGFPKPTPSQPARPGATGPAIA